MDKTMEKMRKKEKTDSNNSFDLSYLNMRAIVLWHYGFLEPTYALFGYIAWCNH